MIRQYASDVFQHEHSRAQRLECVNSAEKRLGVLIVPTPAHTLCRERSAWKPASVDVHVASTCDGQPLSALLPQRLHGLHALVDDGSWFVEPDRHVAKQVRWIVVSPDPGLDCRVLVRHEHDFHAWDAIRVLKELLHCRLRVPCSCKRSCLQHYRQFIGPFMVWEFFRVNEVGATKSR